ncbi:aminotransferase class I/II-fold pyridoxal phosphate-dependent enzyme [Streptomyces sp. KR80]|uniref:aminotransferase class I/II-fold pyridoxal phosphate-dependent enzyme n=1 Tax=Streptomyces sp. KR80 TaxID=3457426 RepID=UPI003FD08A0B
MQRTAAQGRGPAPFGPPASSPGLPVLPELAKQLAAAAGREQEPVGGDAAVLESACGYWSRRGLMTDTSHVTAAPGAEPLLLALLAATGGDVLLSRPCAAWYVPQVRLLGRHAYHAPTPAECGGVPDPFALLETVRRVREEGGDPRGLVLSVADDPSGTVPPPELMHEVCEAAVAEGLLIVSDETHRDTVHHDGDTVLLSPAEMLPADVVVIADLGSALLPHGWPAAIARFPGTRRGAELHAATLDAMAGLRAVLAGPVAAAMAFALTEPEPVRARVLASARLHAALASAVLDVVTRAGVLCRPPQAGSQLYVDLDPLRPALSARGITDSVELEDHLTQRIGEPVPGGHRFGDGPDSLRVRLSTGTLLGATDEERLAALAAPDPLALPHVREALRRLAAVFGEFAGTHDNSTHHNTPQGGAPQDSAPGVSGGRDA